MNHHPIEVVDVHRHFGASPILDGLRFDVHAGETFALLGRNGSGKSTAVRILLGLLEPHAGSSRVAGRPSLQLTPADRARIAFVDEDHHLYPWMRVRDTIDFEAGTRPNFRRELVDRAIDRCALPRACRVFRLSRGQRAQLALLLAIGAEPDVLIFDDPSLGLDAVVRRELLDALIDLLAEGGCTVLLTSHQLHDVERLADRVGILHGGRLIVDATIDDLKRRVVCRRWSPPAGRPDLTPSPCIAGLLACHRRERDFELTLLDCDLALELSLTAEGGKLAPARTPSLEELFRELTADPDGGLSLFADRNTPDESEYLT